MATNSLIRGKSNVDGPIDNDPPPDGGIRAWTVVAMCHVVGFNTWGFLSSFGVLQSFYVAHLGQPPSEISWIGSVQGFMLFFFSAFSGRLSDAGYFHQTLFVGTALLILGVFSASVATNYWQLLLSQGVCVGIGGGLIFIPALSLVATYFIKRRSLALSICACGNSVGGLFYAAILQNVLPKLGIGWALRIIGLVFVATLIPANFFLKPRRIKRSKGPIVEWSAFKEPPYAFFAGGMFLWMLGMWVPVFYLGSFAKDRISIDTKNAATLLLIINGVGVAGRVVPALLAPTIGPMNLLIPLTFISGLILLCWAGVNSYAGLVAFDVFYGILIGAAQGMLPPSLGSLTSDLSKMGVRMGMIFSLLGFAILIGNPLAGALITTDHGKYLSAQMFAGTSMIAGVALLVAARIARVGWKLFVLI
ncbi:Aspyridones efflux apdF [Hyphodiscus hymeniophilus]|uniref:Aspyridones efflux apdF n=1 Tax=Hyphodiscus hymeniophilus TaxID=353542 RepID=A0A9P6VIP2_9HELO|nr:Aspyridones efflux apdF [Hyphodiscus hymeniophilus]